MPEQNPQNVAAFNPANFSLSASLSANEAPTLTYSVIANSDQNSLSSYVQTVFHGSSGTNLPGATLTDQAQPAIRDAEDMQSYSNDAVYSQNDTITRTFAPPIINARQYRNQTVEPYRLTDQAPVIGDAIYYPTAPTQPSESFAPPTDRSALPYVPKVNSQPSERSKDMESVLDVSKHTAPKSDSEKSNPTRSQALIEKTKMVDLRARPQQSAEKTFAEQPTRDDNTTADQQLSSSTPAKSAELYNETGFLKRQAFSSKFSVTRDEVNEERSTHKIIYLKSSPAKERSAKLEVPQFQSPVSLKAEPVQPKSVPDYTMLPPIAPQTPTAEPTLTVSEATTFLPEATPLEKIEETTSEPVATFTNPFESVKTAVEDPIEQPVDTNSEPVKEELNDSTIGKSPFESAETSLESKLIEPEIQQIAAASKAIETSFQPVKQPVLKAENTKTNSPSSGFSDADFNRLEKSEIVEAPPAPPTDTRANPFHVVGYRQAKADTKVDIHKKEINYEVQNGSQQQTQIILPKFEFKPISSSHTSQTQLTTMTVQNANRGRQPDHQFETPWLSPWWMLIGLIPLALYLGTTKLFQDDEDDFAYRHDDFGPQNSFDFGSDYGKSGGSKSDAVYGNDDSLSKIQSTIRKANQQPVDSSDIESEVAPLRSSVAFAESLIFDLPSTEACADIRLAQEISSDQSPNFSAIEIEIETSRTKKTRNKKSAKKSKKRKR